MTRLLLLALLAGLAGCGPNPGDTANRDQTAPGVSATQILSAGQMWMVRVIDSTQRVVCYGWGDYRGGVSCVRWGDTILIVREAK